MRDVATPSSISSATSVVIFIAIMIITGVACAIRLNYATNPSKKNIQRHYANYDADFHFFYMKATAYRELFSTHIFLSNAFKFTNLFTTFIIVYCAMMDEKYILLFSMLSALSGVISLTIPFETYAQIYVNAARKLEDVILSENISQKSLLKAYNEAEKIVKEKFM